ncbi:hypothetical protein FDI24_gp147 [Acidovorax phage ACP17]|uniref:Uncharacterized protein n=1 Tax=Acidovorax phage ACP17 TaxID=2010329 RepID=A0A218M2Z3_9CAUD|nr:hypothetical protein FDI24_gp147 [Acidovorax phage ACP17]ASD50428.1 hypothetical protein [Acidovorax phage ACP17]
MAGEVNVDLLAIGGLPVMGVQYHRFPGTTVTVCALTLENGFTVVGMSAAADPNLFDADKGMKFAFEDATQKVWDFAAFEMRRKAHEGQQA